MFSFSQADRPQFGGIGVMVEPPMVEVAFEPARDFELFGEHVERIRQFVMALASNWHGSELPNCKMTISAPPDHTGLGVGTQLGLSVAAGLRQFWQLPEIAVAELATSVGRGLRSSVGTYGFEHGGLIVDGGKRQHTAASTDAANGDVSVQPNSPLGVLAHRVDVPREWRFVLVSSRRAPRGLAGTREMEAFAQLPSVPRNVSDELWNIANAEMLPAIERNECDAFGDAVYRFNVLAGECFATVQGGPFASTDVAMLVHSIRDFGVPGVGQSSWGPTVFAVTASDDAAKSLVDWLRGQPACRDADISIALPNNSGAHINTL
jgi:beta-RFAP synthase